MLGVQMPVAVGNLGQVSIHPISEQVSSGRGLTASGFSLESSGPGSRPLSRPQGVSMPPSIMASATWTPLGANSRASDWVSARWANLPAAKEPKRAEPRMEAVAPVTISVGG